LRREATICAGRPISAPAVAKPQHDGNRRAPTNAPACRSDSYQMRRRGAKSFVDDLVLSRGVVLSRADLFCDLLRLSPLTRRFVGFRPTYLRRQAGKRRTRSIRAPLLYSAPVDATAIAIPAIVRLRRFFFQFFSFACRPTSCGTLFFFVICVHAGRPVLVDCSFCNLCACRTTSFSRLLCLTTFGGRSYYNL
jgi:hypothetical protein